MNSNIKKLLSAILVSATLFTAVGCGVKVVPEESNQSVHISQSVSKTSSQVSTQNSSQASTQNSSSKNSSVSSSSAPSSSSVHKCTFDQKVATKKYLAKEATYLDGGQYYYSCACGEKSSEVFQTEVLDYDYSQIDEYVNMIITKGSYENPFWNTERPNDPATWNYIDGCLLNSIMKLHKMTDKAEYWNFVNAYMNYLVDAKGSMKGYSMRDYNLDNINEGRMLFSMLEKKPSSTKYKLAIDKLYEQIKNQPKTSLGSFWHKQRYTDQVWLDGLYMAQPFYVMYINTYGDGDLSPVMRQYDNVEKYMKDAKTGLYYHGFDVTKSASWADAETGLSQNFWLRAMGWYYASLSDLTALIDKDKNPEEWTKIQGYLKGAVDSVIPYIDEQTRMLYQVVDKGAVKDNNGVSNYLETSGTALIAYAILNGVNTGALDQSYWNVGKSIFNGICINKLKTDNNGNFVLTDICKVAGLGLGRDGSFEYYLSEPIVSNEAKGVAPFLMAYVEILAHNQK